MSRRLLALLVLGLFFTGDVPARAQRRAHGRGNEADARQYGWLSSLETGKEQARTSGKPLMVVIRCVP